MECSVLESAPKQSEIEVAVRCKNESVTMFASALCRKFPNALFYVVCLAYHCWVTRLSLSSGVSLLVY